MKLAGYFLLAAVLTLGFRVLADDAPAGGVAAGAQRMQELRKAVDDAERAYIAAFEKDRDSTQVDLAWDFYRQLNQTNLPQVFDLAAREPASEESLEMFKWIVTNRFVRSEPFTNDAWKAVAFIRDYHADDPGIARVCKYLGAYWEPDCPPAVELLQAAQKNPDREVRAQATMGLGRLKKKQAGTLTYFQNAPPGNARFEKTRARFLAGTDQNTVPRLTAEEEALFGSVLTNYADCPTQQPTNTWAVKATLGEAATAELYELQHLSLGSVAPEISGEDIDGQPLKLSDYRGKVVVLSFWAAWCGPCMQLMPGEVRLVERMQGRPFALVGVNGDGRREDARKACLKNHATWHSFWSEKGPSGPIPMAWNVTGWPAMFVIDQNGVIRFRMGGYGGTNTDNILSEEVDKLLGEFPAKGT